MKKLFLLAVTISFFAAGCKKGNVSPSTDSSWTLGSTTYKAILSHKESTSTATFITFIDRIEGGSDPRVNAINFEFKSAPTTGSYELVSLSTELNDNKLHIATNGPGGGYGYIGTGVKVQVTVTGGKVKVVVPEVTVKGEGTLPDAKLTASVQEMN